MALATLGATRAADPDPAEYFEKKVRPVLVEHCHACHSTTAKKLKGGLRLDSREAALKGGDTGPALVPGKPAASRLIEAIRYENVELRMPPRGKLSQQSIADLTAWVAMGAPWPAERTPAVAAAASTSFDLAARKAAHWAWQPIRSHTPPAVNDASWPFAAVDQFILAKLEANKLWPAQDADRRTLLRRLYFDLIGLPPPPDDVETFVNDAAPDALEKVVDRLLASQHFGERWGRHWLDLVRYAESRGHEFDYTSPNAYQYRDYVVRALNVDVPYNQFVVENLAGDLLQPPRLHPSEHFNESVLGTGFWYLGEQVHSPVDLRQDEADRLDNMVDVFSKALLGLTISCARCHDHKFDAISTKDYYSLLGFLESSSYRQVRFDTLEQERRLVRELADLRDRQRPSLGRAAAAVLRPGVASTSAYLLAARDVLRKAGASATATSETAAGVARAHKVDGELLQGWLAHLKRALNDSRDPLHGWAKSCNATTAAEAKSTAADVRKSLLDKLQKAYNEANAALQGIDVVADYRSAAPACWLADGPVFGLGPVQPGMIRLGERGLHPPIRIIDYAAAERDPSWNRLREAPGTESEPKTLGEHARAGRTLRTPSFTLTRGKLFYLIRGNGVAFAVVNGHVMIGGPLHGRVVQPLKAGDSFQWLLHDLTPYRGHRVHVEFTPDPKTEFAVALVVQAESQPEPVERPNAEILRLLTENDNPTEEKLAVSYQRLLLKTVERLAQDRIANAPDAASWASLADWLVRHLELFVAAKDRHKLTEAVQPFLEQEAKLAARMQGESRLAPAILDGNGVNEQVFIRGSPRARGPLAPRRFLEALAGPEPMAIPQGSGRLELARLVVDPARNPLVARVAVNRVWHHLFGRGIVASVDNFGVLGEPPTHPELLDYLAEQFVRDGWSLKKLIRTLVLSRTYRMSSRSNEAADALDAGNLLLHRMRIRRLEGEAIRDALLVVSGRAELRPYGPPVPIYLTPFQDGRGRPASGPLDGNGRRSLYLAVRRNFISPFLLAFDTPAPFSTVGRRTVSNVPAQALILMNDPFVHQQAEVWAKKTLARPGSASARVTLMYQTAIARPPSIDEMGSCLEFLRRQREQADDLAAWTDLAHILFNMKEFIYLN